MKLSRHQLEKKKWSGGRNLFQQGFTLLETIVSVAIVLIISAQVLVSFSGLNEASTLDRAAQELGFNVRRAQNMSLSVTGVKIGGVMQIPRAVGLRLTTKPGENDTYFFFADQNGDRIYNDPAERIEPDILLPGKIRITSITGELLATSSAHIIFYTPEATVVLSNAVGLAIPDFMDITLKALSGAKRVVRVRMSGQVTVR